MDNKRSAGFDFRKRVKQTWMYEVMSEREQRDLDCLLREVADDDVMMSDAEYHTQWERLQIVCAAFCAGIGAEELEMRKWIEVCRLID